MEETEYDALLYGYIREVDQELDSKFIPHEIYTTCWCFYFDNDRQITSIQPIPIYTLLHSVLFPKEINDDNIIDLDALKKHLSLEGRLELKDIFTIINKTIEILSKEANLLKLSGPFSICGQIMGRYWDLLRCIETGGNPKETQYLFLGRYVNKGNHGMEVILYLCAHKIMYPNTFYLLRGNHECQKLTEFYNFKDEVLYKYNSIDLYQLILKLFNNLPIAAVIDKTIFCVFSGLSPDIDTLQDIEEIDRFQDIPREGPLCDLMWSDPVNEPQHDDTKNVEPVKWFAMNHVTHFRNAGYVFGIDAITQFLERNDLLLIIRSKHMNEEGFELSYIDKKTNKPMIVSISGPPFNDFFQGKGAMIRLENELINIRQFEMQSHPYYLPNFMDLFQFSLPFMAEKVTDIIYKVLNHET